MLLHADRLCAPRALGRRPSSVRGAVCRRRESCSYARPADCPRQTSDNSLNNLLNAFFLTFPSSVSSSSRSLTAREHFRGSPSAARVRMDSFSFRSAKSSADERRSNLNCRRAQANWATNNRASYFFFILFSSAIRVDQYSPSTSRAPSARCERLLLQSSVVCLCLCFCFNFLRLVRQTDVYGKREAYSIESDGIKSAISICLRTHTAAPMISNC